MSRVLVCSTCSPGRRRPEGLRYHITPSRVGISAGHLQYLMQQLRPYLF
jgi:hypothetical protein